MPRSRLTLCLAILALVLSAGAQTAPTAYSITQSVVGAPAGSYQNVYRNGPRVLIDMFTAALPGQPAHHALTYYDLATHTSHTWDPADTPPSCSAGTFSGDWGDPFEVTKELTAGIAKGELKPAGMENIHGIPTKTYAGSSQGQNLKAWFDEKDRLVLRYTYGAAGAPATAMIDITRVSLTAPPPAMFSLPAYCGSVKPPPTPADLIATETGDSAANWVNAIYGPGSKDSCSILVHVVAAKTMAPLNRKFQAAIDTTYYKGSATPQTPPAYTFGVGDDGTSTYSGGGLHEITSQIRNFTLRIDNPPPYFIFGINIPTPHHGADAGLIYRQCFAPVTNLYYVVKDPANPADGADYLYAKSGKYAAAK
jgi:hypothetical protein